MLNLFPQQFFAVRKSSTLQLASKRTLLWLCTLILSIVIIPAAESGSVYAQSAGKANAQVVHPSCRIDTGAPVIPMRGVGAWAIILNFNHPKSTTHTMGCLATIDALEPELQVTYKPGILCRIINNIDGVEVGMGNAPFDGQFQIVCPRQIYEPDPNTTYEKFYVHAKARFPQASGSYKIIEHQNVEVTAEFAQDPINEDWKAIVTSRYGRTVFQDSEPIDMIPEHRFNINSTVYNGVGSHYINRSIIETQRQVQPFGFDFDKEIVIGGSGASWTLYEMVVDPPGMCADC